VLEQDSNHHSFTNLNFFMSILDINEELDRYICPIFERKCAFD